MTSLGNCIVVLSIGDSDTETILHALNATFSGTQTSDADSTTGNWPEEIWSTTGNGLITCSIEWPELPLKRFPTPKDFIELLNEQNEKYLAMLSALFNVYAAVYYRRAMNSKSGFLARVGRRKKRQ